VSAVAKAPHPISVAANIIALGMARFSSPGPRRTRSPGNRRDDTMTGLDNAAPICILYTECSRKVKARRPGERKREVISRTPLREEIAGILRDWIVKGRLSPDRPLREPTLAADLGVSRTPLREALLSLEREGFLRFEMGRGFHVLPLAEETVREVYPMLGALESLALRFAPVPSPEVIDKLRGLNHRIRRQDESKAKRFGHDQRLHELLIDGCGNARLLGSIAELKRLTRRFDGAADRGVADIETSCREHEAIIDALARGDLAEAGRLLESHWQRGIDTVVNWLARRDSKTLP